VSDIRPLDVEFYSNDLNSTVTIREWLKELLFALWEEQESFSGKRPLGNSDWSYDPVPTLIKMGLICGALDADGYVEDVDIAEYDKFMMDCIKEL
jgi:hypothetical protein